MPFMLDYPTRSTTIRSGASDRIALIYNAENVHFGMELTCEEAQAIADTLLRHVASVSDARAKRAKPVEASP